MRYYKKVRMIETFKTLVNVIDIYDNSEIEVCEFQRDGIKSQRDKNLKK